jgi:hypothetical protein
MTLSVHSLRCASSPFDWVNYYDEGKYFNNFRGNIDIILNQFKNFMNIEDFEKIPKWGVVYNKRTKWCFWHDFAEDKDLVNDFPYIKEKYERRAERLLCNFIQADSILIVNMQDMMYRDRNMQYLADYVISESVVKYGRLIPQRE